MSQCTHCAWRVLLCGGMLFTFCHILVNYPEVEEGGGGGVEVGGWRGRGDRVSEKVRE